MANFVTLCPLCDLSAFPAGFSVMPVMHVGKFCIIFTWIFRSSAPGVHQPSQGAFLQPGNIAAADAKLIGSLLLGSRTLPSQAVAQLQQRPFPRRQGIHQAAQAGGIGAALAIVFHHGVIGQGVGQSQLPAAGFQWLLQRNSRTFTPNFSQFHS